MPATIDAFSDLSLARVRLDVRGAVEGEVFYVLRRDQNGIVMVRDTSQSTVVAVERVVQRNLVRNPNAVNTTGFTSTMTLSNDVAGRLRLTATQPTGNYARAWGMGPNDRVPAAFHDNTAARVGVYGHATKTLYARLVIQGYTGTTSKGIIGQSPLMTVLPTAVLAIEAFGKVTDPTIDGLLPILYVYGSNTNGPLVVGDWLDTDNWRADVGSSAPLPGQTVYGGMSGDSPSGSGTPTMYYRWAGVPNASISEGYTYGAELYDYEARQKMFTDYILTDEDGIELATRSITTGAWGTWLKHLGKPYLNVKVKWHIDSEYTRVANRALLRARGARFPAALHDRRSAPTGSIQVVTETDEAARALTTLLEDGAVIMLDVSPEFGVPVRYVSVGDLSGNRLMTNGLGLRIKARIWTLPIDEVAAPVGLPAGQGFTYANIAPLYGSYAAIPATTESYENLAVGEQS